MHARTHVTHTHTLLVWYSLQPRVTSEPRRLFLTYFGIREFTLIFFLLWNIECAIDSEWNDTISLYHVQLLSYSFVEIPKVQLLTPLQLCFQKNLIYMCWCGRAQNVIEALDFTLLQNSCKWLEKAEALLTVFVLGALNSVLEPMTGIHHYTHVAVHLYGLSASLHPSCSARKLDNLH